MNQKGFTVAELCVCCAIMSILAAVSAPVWGKIQQSLVLRTEIRQLHGNLQHAKIAAIKNNSYVVFKVDNQGYAIFVDDGAGGGTAGDWIQQKQEETLVVKSYDSRVSFEKTTFSANRTRFNGRACGMKAGRVVLKNDNGRKIEVVVSIVGRIRTANV